ncbi:hypothetical protein [Sorangium sp. So ce341]|uniref:hypothetical protein n=1 Tax=Sorangium sp. So ce341 TaxID=3133302 RepID=UPI003F61FE14
MMLAIAPARAFRCPLEDELSCTVGAALCAPSPLAGAAALRAPSRRGDVTACCAAGAVAGARTIAAPIHDPRSGKGGTVATTIPVSRTSVH